MVGRACVWRHWEDSCWWVGERVLLPEVQARLGKTGRPGDSLRAAREKVIASNFLLISWPLFIALLLGQEERFLL